MAKRKAPKAALRSSAKKQRLSPSPDPAPETTPGNSTQSSALLRLPAEIRNKVYEYVLTADSGHLSINAPPNPAYRDLYAHQHGNKIAVRELNKLRYVCRDLYHETAFFEYEFNTLVFEQVERAQIEPDKQLLKLESLCPPARFSRIKRIELHIKALAIPYSRHHSYFLTMNHLDAYARVASFCRRHPGMEVKYVLNSFSWHPYYHLTAESRAFINQGIVLLKALRDIDVSYLDPDPVVAQELLEIGTSYRRKGNTASWYAPNLTFHPNQDELDEESFRKHAGKSNDGASGVLDKWIEVTKSWVKDGF